MALKLGDAATAAAEYEALLATTEGPHAPSDAVRASPTPSPTPSPSPTPTPTPSPSLSPSPYPNQVRAAAIRKLDEARQAIA